MLRRPSSVLFSLDLRGCGLPVTSLFMRLLHNELLWSSGWSVIKSSDPQGSHWTPNFTLHAVSVCVCNLRNFPSSLNIITEAQAILKPTLILSLFKSYPLVRCFCQKFSWNMCFQTLKSNCNWCLLPKSVTGVILAVSFLSRPRVLWHAVYF